MQNSSGRWRLVIIIKVLCLARAEDFLREASGCCRHAGLLKTGGGPRRSDGHLKSRMTLFSIQPDRNTREVGVDKHSGGGRAPARRAASGDERRSRCCGGHSDPEQTCHKVFSKPCGLFISHVHRGDTERKGPGRGGPSKIKVEDDWSRAPSVTLEPAA